jgi:hypothetical protein
MITYMGSSRAGKRPVGVRTNAVTGKDDDGFGLSLWGPSVVRALKKFLAAQAARFGGLRCILRREFGACGDPVRAPGIGG